MQDHSIERVQIIDLADNLFKHTTYLRNEGKNGAEYAGQLGARIDAYFAATKEKNHLEIDAVEVVDRLYRQIGGIELVDRYVHYYFQSILRILFQGYGHHGVRVFFILDNSLRNDRFKLLGELLGEMGIAFIHPYDVDIHAEEYTPSHDRFEAKPFGQVSKEIEAAASQGLNIFYVEKDDSINYLNYVLYLAESLQEHYTCAMRNTSIYESGSAQLLAGSFGGTLKTKDDQGGK